MKSTGTVPTSGHFVSSPQSPEPELKFGEVKVGCWFGGVDQNVLPTVP